MQHNTELSQKANIGYYVINPETILFTFTQTVHRDNTF